MILDRLTSPSSAPPTAPELLVERWFNTDAEPTLAGLTGNVVLIEAFQMLCPACVAHGLPQAQRVADTFRGEVVVLGLHTVFEHHEAMGAASLEAFLSEYGITFPVGIDVPNPDGDIPLTMARYALRGTPSLLVVDRAGRLRLHAFGPVDDLSLGAALARLLAEPVPTAAESTPTTPDRSTAPDRSDPSDHRPANDPAAGCDPVAGCAMHEETAP